MNGLDPGLAALAAAHGVLARFTDVHGIERVVPEASLLAVLRALGAPVARVRDCADALRARAGSSDAEPVHVAWNGEISHLDTGPHPAAGATAEIRIRYEDGTERRFDAVTGNAPGRMRTRVLVPGPFPLGIHDVEIEAGGRVSTTRVLAAPRLAYLPPRPRAWGIFLQLHAIGPAGTGLPGRYTDLGAVLHWVGTAGGAYVGTLPILPTYLDAPFEPSPYAPVTRLFVSELFIDIDAAHALAGLPGPVPGAAPPAGTDRIEYGAAWRHLLCRLAPMAEAFFESAGAQEPRFQRFLQGHPGVQDYARFRAAVTGSGIPWTDWDRAMKSGRLQRGDFDDADYRFHLFAAWCAEEQLAGLGRTESARLYLDLPLGVHPAGYDTWRFRTLFAEGISVGAPPDAFFAAGQNWGFPPLIPGASRTEGHRYFIECLRVQLRFAGALRLDHAMSLERLYWIPDGCSATEGAYVRYPREELVALLALESHRHEAMIVGEDLGTVTPSVRAAMDEHAIQRMFVVQFEADPDRDALPAAGVDTVVSVNTHDLPTTTGWLRGADVDTRLATGLISPDTASAVRASRARTVAALCRWLELPEGEPDPDELLRALLARLAGGQARLLMANLEDAWLETRQTNMPGTTSEWPNWQWRAPLDAAALPLDTRVRRLMAWIDRHRADGGPTLPANS